MKHILMLSILINSHLIRHSGTGCAFKDSHMALKHLRHSESTRALGQSEDTQGLGYLRNLGTRTIRALSHLGTRELKALTHLGTWALEALYLADSTKSK